MIIKNPFPPMKTSHINLLLEAYIHDGLLSLFAGHNLPCDKWSQTRRYFVPSYFQYIYKQSSCMSRNHSGIGGSLGWNLINHLCNAHDLCLIALSSSVMQYLLDMCDSIY